jgi:hypothetical protein
LLEAFAHSIADRSAGPVIERFGVVCVWTFHDQFRALEDLFDQVTAYQVSGQELVSGCQSVLGCFG